MTTEWPCPVCGAPTIRDYQGTIEGALCESAEHCPNGCQEYVFSYGSSEERIGQRVWYWHHTETAEEERKRRQERAEEIQRIRDECRLT